MKNIDLNSERKQQTKNIGPFGAVRAFTVMLGGPIVLLTTVARCAISLARSLRKGKAPRPLPLCVTVAAAIYTKTVRPWMGSWGATPEEACMELPGDESVPDAGLKQTHAVTIDAPVDKVWPWVAQIGQDRGGFYSYRWLENLAGCRMRNAERIHPEWQNRGVGETVLLHPASGLKLLRFEPECAFVLEGGWHIALKPDGPNRTRLLARLSVKRGAASVAYGLLLEIPHFVMERKMLLGIKQRVEQQTP